MHGKLETALRSWWKSCPWAPLTSCLDQQAKNKTFISIRVHLIVNLMMQLEVCCLNYWDPGGECLGPCLSNTREVPIKFILISVSVSYLVRSSIFALPGLFESVLDSYNRLVLVKETASLRPLWWVRFSMPLCLCNVLEPQTLMGPHCETEFEYLHFFSLCYRPVYV